MKISFKNLENKSSLLKEEIDSCLEKATKRFGADSCSIHGEPGIAYIKNIYPCGSYSVEFDICCGQYGIDLGSEDEKIYLDEKEKEIEPNWGKYYFKQNGSRTIEEEIKRNQNQKVDLI